MLQLRFGVQVEDLEDVSSWFIWSFQGNNVISSVHNCTINLASWSSHNVHFICEFDDTNLRSTRGILISDTYILFGLKTCDSELKEARIDSKTAKVSKLSMSEWIRCLHF